MTRHIASMLAVMSAIHQYTRPSPFSDIIHRSLLFGTLALVPLAPRLLPIYPDYAIVASLFASSSCYHLIVHFRSPHPPPFYHMFCHTTCACSRYVYHRRSLRVQLILYTCQLWKIPHPNTVSSRYTHISFAPFTRLPPHVNPFTPSNPSYHIPIPYQ